MRKIPHQHWNCDRNCCLCAFCCKFLIVKWNLIKISRLNIKHLNTASMPFLQEIFKTLHFIDVSSSYNHPCNIYHNCLIYVFKMRVVAKLGNSLVNSNNVILSTDTKCSWLNQQHAHGGFMSMLLVASWPCPWLTFMSMLMGASWACSWELHEHAHGWFMSMLVKLALALPQ